MDQYQEKFVSNSYRGGLEGMEKSKKYIKDYFKSERMKEQEMLNNFIHNEPVACVASNLEDMLKKNWTEEKRAYVLISQINSCQEKRIKNIINENRYSNI